MRTIAMLTSGGDAPGMNACIRAVARAGFSRDLRVKGIRFGLDGLMRGDIYEMNMSSVGDIIQKGGTILGSARSEEFRTKEGQNKALTILRRYGIEGLIIMGGDGSFKAAEVMDRLGIRTVAIPCTIDNDMGYTDYTIGFHTACETVIESIGRLRDTSDSHARANIVVVMGRNCGDIALFSGLGGGAESIIVPEHEVSVADITDRILRGKLRGKRHHIVVLSEGARDPYTLRDEIEKITGVETRITILGHVQRGGSPCLTDRLLACTMGYEAVKVLLDGSSSLAIGAHGQEIFTMPIAEAIRVSHHFHEDLFQVAYELSS